MKNPQKTWYKKLVVTALSVSIGLSVVAAGAPGKAEAAASSEVTNATALTASATSTSRGSQVISIGKRYLGTPYKFGATAGQTRNFDCSSFTQYVFKKVGVNLPRTSQQQARVGKHVSRSDLRVGDLVFFSIPGKPGVIHHVGIYAGNNKILQTYGAGGVRVTDIHSGTWSSRYMTARRVL
ncbi:C40 family peptidase [Paenibacillus qinlingensis]|uniref:Cell wall-associated NlpC family hydrolase n=1 Tax=Paenibacillus qinlingensis TaxID=1837343 RepID=A0ABU1P469_9BACL|nr:C40 family peptidase [Paenibacillus qinlingensis]MDR6554344.1 cell wall-associated NlpC family hydrolase [Paenibacillus qinlingensis]